MFKGNWSCSGCKGDITELPFEPRSTDNLMCRDCHSKRQGDRPQKQMFEGDWTCSGCSTKITQLPFEPRNTSNLTCRDCYMKTR